MSRMDPECFPPVNELYRMVEDTVYDAFDQLKQDVPINWSEDDWNSYDTGCLEQDLLDSIEEKDYKEMLGHAISFMVEYAKGKKIREESESRYADSQLDVDGPN